MADLETASGPERIAVVILAGGEGARLGGAVKANLTIGGVPLLDRVMAVVSGPWPLLIAIGRHAPSLLTLPPGVAALPDPDGPVRGPLAGLAAGATWAASQPAPPDILVSVAVDNPFLPGDYVARLIERVSAGSNAAMAAYEGQAYPTNAAWRVPHLLPLLGDPSPQAVAQAGLKGLARRLNASLVEWPASPDGNPFANLNTEADRADLERRASTRAAASRPQNAAQNRVGKADQSR